MKINYKKYATVGVALGFIFGLIAGIMPVVNAGVFYTETFDTGATGIDDGTLAWFTMDNVGVADKFELSSGWNVSSPNSLELESSTTYSGPHGYLNLTSSYSYIGSIQFWVRGGSSGAGALAEDMYFNDSADNNVMRMRFYNHWDTQGAIYWYDVSTGWEELLDEFTDWEGVSYKIKITHEGINYFNIKIYNSAGALVKSIDKSGSYAGTYSTFDYIYFKPQYAGDYSTHRIFIDNLQFEYDSEGYGSGYPETTGITCPTDENPKTSGSYDTLYYTFNDGSEYGSKVLIELKNDSGTTVYINQLDYPEGSISLTYQLAWGTGNYTWCYSDWYYGSDPSRYYEEVDFSVLTDQDPTPEDDYLIYGKRADSNDPPVYGYWLDIYWKGINGKSFKVNMSGYDSLGELAGEYETTVTGTGSLQVIESECIWSSGYESIRLTLKNATTGVIYAVAVYYKEDSILYYDMALNKNQAYTNETVIVTYHTTIDMAGLSINVYDNDNNDIRVRKFIVTSTQDSFSTDFDTAGNYTYKFCLYDNPINIYDSGELIRIYEDIQGGSAGGLQFTNFEIMIAFCIAMGLAVFVGMKVGAIGFAGTGIVTTLLFSRPELGEFQLLPPEVGYFVLAGLVMVAIILWLD